MHGSSNESNGRGRARATLARLASAIVPGLGQALRGRLVDGGLFLFAALWLRGFLGGHAEPGERVVAFLVGAPAMTGGLRVPVLVVFTALLVGLHALAAWDAGRIGTGRPLAADDGRGSGEV